MEFISRKIIPHLDKQMFIMTVSHLVRMGKLSSPLQAVEVKARHNSMRHLLLTCSLTVLSKHKPSRGSLRKNAQITIRSAAQKAQPPLPPLITSTSSLNSSSNPWCNRPPISLSPEYNQAPATMCLTTSRTTTVMILTLASM